jgi:O-antigen/teichoic acid export membrane protein
MNLKAHAATNVGAIWLNLIVHAAVGFFLSPFILHRLGDELFSLWVLVFTITGYSGLLDLGIRSAIVRYVANFVGVDDQDSLARFVNTSLAFYCVAGLLTLLLTGIGYFYFPVFFKLPSAELLPARLLLLIVGIGVALSFPFSVFMGVLEGLQRFASLGLSQVGFTLLRGVLILIALNRGGKLLAIGAITVGVNLLSYVLFMCIARRVAPIRLSLRWVEANAFRSMIRYGAFAFIILIAEKLRFQSDVTVIGALLSTTAITSFTIGAKLVEYSTYAVRSMAQIFIPMSSQLYAAGNFPQLRRTLVAGNRACALIIFPLCLILIILGKPILELWVGVTYLSSYPILVILAISRSVYLAQSASTKMLVGMGKHRALAIVLLVEGLSNVTLSILLVGQLGIMGVALGTAIPLIVTSLFFLPYHVSRHVGMALRTFVGRSYLMPAAICIPLASVLLSLQHKFPIQGYRGLMLQLSCGGLTYCAGLSFTLGFNWGKYLQSAIVRIRLGSDSSLKLEARSGHASFMSRLAAFVSLRPEYSNGSHVSSLLVHSLHTRKLEARQERVLDNESGGSNHG